MMLRIIDLANRPIGSFSTPCADRWLKVQHLVGDWFDVDPDDVTSRNDEDDFDLICVRGEVVGRIISTAGWAA